MDINGYFKGNIHNNIIICLLLRYYNNLNDKICKNR